jgi:uncharacterized protein YndB with AHSA1/START domain
MMLTRRSRVIRAPRERVWELIGDPWMEPRWWPRAQRVEGVTRRGWTSVLASPRGHLVRADWIVEANEEPVRRRWAQELDGTPFARVFTRNAVEATLEHSDGGTLVTLAFDQRLRGTGRLAPWVIRRAMRKQLDEALEGIEAAVGE